MENQFNTAVGSIQMPMTIPTSTGGGGGQFTKRTDIQLLPPGANVGIIYSVVHVGTQNTEFKGKKGTSNNIIIGVEFPHFKQLFYEEDTAPRSTVLSREMPFFAKGTSNFKKILEAVSGGTLTDEAANAMSPASLLGQVVLCMIETKNYASKPGQYNKIASFSALGMMPVPQNFTPELEHQLFFVDPAGNNFKTTNFANLPRFLKETIMKSHEALAYAQNGGWFAKKAETTEQPNQQPQGSPQPNQFSNAPAPQAVPQAMPQTEKVFVFTDTQFTLEQYLANQWTETTLVEAGKGRWEERPVAQAMPQAPQSPQQAPQQFQQQSMGQEFGAEPNY